VVLSIYPDANVVKQLLASGATDMNVFNIPFLQAYDLASQNQDKLELQTPFEGERVELEMNQGPKGFPALKDVNVRKAIEMGIDRQYIIDNLYDGKTEVPHSYWDGTAWNNPNTPYVGYDPDGAKALLRQAGWYDDTGDGVVKAHGVTGVTDGTPLVLRAATLSAADSSEYESTLLAVQDMLSKIGVKIGTLDTYDLEVFYSPYNSGGPWATGADDLYLMHWATGVDTVNQFQLYSCDTIPSEQNPGGFNASQICNPEIDSLWKQLYTSMSADDRQSAVNRIQDIIADQALTIYIAKRPSAILLNKSIQGFSWGGFAGNPLISLADMKRVTQ
jgi:ABC-type transport system substrate-binding protein